MSGDGDTWVVIPAFNEGPAVRATVEGVLRRGYRVVVVDDCSSDDTAAQLRGLPVTVVRHPVNLGQGAALQTGFELALRRGARTVVTFDADGQHDPDDVAALLRALREHDLDVALGSRFLGRAEALGLVRRLVLRLAVLFTRVTTGLRLTDVHNGLRAFDAAALRRLRIRQNRMAHASEILEEVQRLGLRHREVACTVRYTEYSRRKGQSSLAALDILYDLLMRRLSR